MSAGGTGNGMPGDRTNPWNLSAWLKTRPPEPKVSPCLTAPDSGLGSSLATRHVSVILWHTLCPLPLQIEKVDLRDEGIYTCAATNLAGESKREVALKVLGEDVGGQQGPGQGCWVIPWGPLGLGCVARDGEEVFPS